MPFPPSDFPNSITAGAEKSENRDGGTRSTHVYGEDFNELWSEVIALEQWTRENKKFIAINKTGSLIAANKWVAISGFDAVSGLVTIELADKGTTDFFAQGILPAAIADGATGTVIAHGNFGPIDTTGFTAASEIWLGTNGDALDDPPSGAIDNAQPLARVVKQDAAGQIFVRPADGFLQPLTTKADFSGELAGSKNKWLFPLSTTFYILRGWVVSDLATAGSSGANHWEFQVSNPKLAIDLRATSQSTEGAELIVDNRRIVTLDQNQERAGNQSLEFQIVKVGSPTDLAAAEIIAGIDYVQVPS